MTRFVVLFVSLAFLWTAEKADAQSAAETPATLASSWTLVSMERALSSEKAERAQQPRGLLIFDSAGHAFEWFTVASRQLPDAPLTDPVRTLATYGGFWGDYRVDAAQKRLVFSARGAISPSITAREFSRTFERAGDRLTLTTIDEPHAQGGTRWVWERVPTVDNLSPLYRQVVGFWEYVVEKRVTTAGEVLSEQKRGGPSVIVYTPGGFVGVHFLPINTKPSPFAAGAGRLTAQVAHVLLVAPVAAGLGQRGALSRLADLIDGYIEAMAADPLLGGALPVGLHFQVRAGVVRYGGIDYHGATFLHTWALNVG